MHCITTGAAKRHAISPRNRPASNQSTSRPMTVCAMLSPLELRRIVAEMVD